MRAGEPVHGVDPVTILFDDWTPGGVAIKDPVANLLVLAGISDVGVVGHQRKNPATDHLLQHANAARLQQVAGLEVFGTEPLLEAELNGLGRVRSQSRGQNLSGAGNTHSHGLLAVDVLTGANGGGKLLGVLVRRSRNQDRVDLRRGQQFAVIPEYLGGPGPRDGLLGRLNPVGVEIANGGQAGVRILGHE